MTISILYNIMDSVQEKLNKANIAVRALSDLTDDRIRDVLKLVADSLEENQDIILAANKKDLERLDQSDYRYDRLKLTSDRIRSIAADMRSVASLPVPEMMLEERTLSNGLHLQRVSVPFGVVGVIYEARPNVSADVFSLCFKSRNVCVLKGGSDAENSNKAIVGIIRQVLNKENLNSDFVTLLPSTREATDSLLKARGSIDVLIPRGSKGLIDKVRDEACVPVIETGAGVCHCYVTADSSLEMATNIVLNAKTRRVSVCNALDCLIIDNLDITERLPKICQPLANQSVVIHADESAYNALKDCYPQQLLKHATQDTFGVEFLGYEMAVKTVKDIEGALSHIATYGSGHSETIVTTNNEHARLFHKVVDAACVYVNAPTSFTDGAQFGLGAEIGISTQKLHARGPMALEALMTYKWLITGKGQCRP